LAWTAIQTDNILLNMNAADIMFNQTMFYTVRVYCKLRSIHSLSFSNLVNLLPELQGNVKRKKHNKNKHFPKKIIEDSDDKDGMEDVGNVHNIIGDGMAGFHVGYLPRGYFNMHGAKKFDHVFLRFVTD
jgi:hypothetical protein